MHTSEGDSLHPQPADLTIAICTLGRDGYLQAALTSLLETTPPGVTLRVVLNAPDDPNMSVERITELVAAWDGPVYVSELAERQTIAGAHSAALDAVDTDFVTFMGDDDLVLEPRVERILNLFATITPTPAVIGSHSRRVSGSYEHPRFTTNKDYGPTTVEGWRDDLRSGKLLEVVFPSAVYRTELLRDAGGFEERFGSAMDLASFTRLGQDHPILADPRRTFAHRIHDGSITSSNAQEHAARMRYTQVSMDALRAGQPEPTWDEFLATEASRAPLARARTTRSTMSQALFRQGGAAISSGSLRRGAGKIAASAALSPSTFLRRSKSQVRRGTSGEPVVAVLLKNANQYRVPFYEKLRPALASQGIELRFIVADGLAEDRAKGDRASIAWAEHRPFREINIAGRSLLWQPGFDIASGADLVITEQASKQLFNIALSIGQRALHTRHAFWGHGKNFQAALEGTSGEGLKRRLTERAHWFFAYNDLSAQAAIDAGMPADRITPVMNSTDTDAMRAVLHALPDGTNESVRRELGAGSGPVALFMGGLYPPKRTKFFLESAIELRTLVPDIELIVIGSGSEADLVEGASAEHPWIHAIGASYGDERIRYASIASLQMMPGMVGLNIVDGFALGLPTITTDIDYHSPEIDYLVEDENGFTVTGSPTPSEYAHAVASIFRDAERLERLRNGARQTGRELTIDNMVNHFVDGVVAALEAPPPLMSVDRSTKKLAQNTGFVLVAELVVQATRAATIFVLAELFAKDDLGVYAALLALTTLLAPVSQWGMNHVGVRAIARNVPFSNVWAKVSSTIFFGGLIGTGIAVLLAWILYDVQLWIVIAFGIAQLIGFNTAQAATMMSEAHHRSDVGLRINIAGGIMRLTALGSFYFLGFDRLSQWALFLLVGMTLWGASSAIQVARVFGGQHRATRLTRDDIRLGFGFTFVQTSASGQTDIDKVVLEANGLTSDTANYAPGYRIAEMTTIPLIAIVRATYSEFFRRGESTVREAMAFSKRLTAIASAYGILAGLCLFFLAPLVTIVIDEGKLTEVVDVVRWLAFIPFVKGLQYFPGNVLSGSDHHNLRSAIIFVTAAVNLVGNLIFIPQFGWQAAATTTAVSEFLFAGMLWTAVIVLARREARQSV